MPYQDIMRGWNRLMNDWKSGNEQEKKIWKNIMDDIERSRKTHQAYIQDLCERNRRKNEEKFRKLDNEDTDDLERAIILCEYFSIAFPLALAGYVYNPLNKPINWRIKK